MIRATRLSLALCLALALASAAAAQTLPFSCSSLPANWGSDSDNNDNGPWSDLTEEPSAAIYDQIWLTFTSRYGSKAIANWTGCATSDMTNSSVGCQQTAGQGENYALQVNFTCPGTSNVTLGMTVDVNTYSSYINVDDMDVEFVAVDGEIVTGNLDDSDWWESNDDVWGDFYSFDQQNNQQYVENDQDDENNDDDNDYYNNNNQNQNQNQDQNNQNQDEQGAAFGAQQAAIGQQIASGEISGEEGGQELASNGQAFGAQMAQENGN